MKDAMDIDARTSAADVMKVIIITITIIIIIRPEKIDVEREGSY